MAIARVEWPRKQPGSIYWASRCVRPVFWPLRRGTDTSKCAQWYPMYSVIVLHLLTRGRKYWNHRCSDPPVNTLSVCCWFAPSLFLEDASGEGWRALVPPGSRLQPCPEISEPQSPLGRVRSGGFRAPARPGTPSAAGGRLPGKHPGKMHRNAAKTTRLCPAWRFLFCRLREFGVEYSLFDN